MSEQNTGPVHEQQTPDRYFMHVPISDPGTYQIVETVLRELSISRHPFAPLTQLSFESPDDIGAEGEITFIDAAPIPALYPGTNKKTTRDLNALQFFSEAAFSEHDRLVDIERLHPDEATRLVVHNISDGIKMIARTPGLYEALTHYLVEPNIETTEALVAPLRRSDGVVNLLDHPLIVAALMREEGISGESIDVICQSNDLHLQRIISSKLLTAVEKLSGENVDIESSGQEISRYLDPFLRASELEVPNELAIDQLVWVHRELLASNIFRIKTGKNIFPNEAGYIVYRDVQEKLRKTAMTSLHPSMQDMMHQFFFTENGSLEAQMTHFIAFVGSYLKGQILFEEWIEEAYPKGSQLKILARRMYEYRDTASVKRSLALARDIVHKSSNLSDHEKDYQEDRINFRLYYLNRILESDKPDKSDKIE